MTRTICGHCGGTDFPGMHQPGCTSPLAHGKIIASAGFEAWEPETPNDDGVAFHVPGWVVFVFGTIVGAVFL